MAVYRAQCSVQVGSLLPKDAVMINPCFHDQGITSSPNTLASDLATSLGSKYGTRQTTVKLYDLEDTTPPRRPVGQATVNTGGSAEATMPREVALCLSFYSHDNTPRKRGRLYIPVMALASSGSAGVRPTAQQIADVKSFSDVLKNLGGPDVDWVVYSKAASAHYPVTNFWVDDEWDTQRRRQPRALTRSTGTTTED